MAETPFSNLRGGGLGTEGFQFADTTFKPLEFKPLEFKPLAFTPAGLDTRAIRNLGQVLQGQGQKITTNTGLPPPAARPAIGVTNSSQKQQTDSRQAGGIASPLTEGNIDNPVTLQRSYWPIEVIVSSDGILAFEVEQVESISFLDFNGAEVVFTMSQEL